MNVIIMLSAKVTVSDFRRTYFCKSIRSSLKNNNNKKKSFIKVENVQFIVTEVDVSFSESVWKA